MRNFKILFAFKSTELEIIEIKKTNVPEGTPPAEMYFWLAVSGDQLEKLIFKTMSENGQSQIREFKNSLLRFDHESAEFIKNNELFKLAKIPESQVSTSAIKLIEKEFIH